MRRIPRFVLDRNRSNGLADEQASGYKEQPRKPGGKCARCGKVEDEHFAGQYGAMMKWLWAALETNYASFLSDMGLDAETLAKLKAGATTAMGLSKASPTPPSGASSSPASAG